MSINGAGRKTRSVILCCCLFWIGPVAPAMSADIDVFTTDSFPFDQALLDAYGIRALYNVDEFRRADQVLNQDLPADEAQAGDIVAQRLQQHHQSLAHGFRGSFLLDRLDLFALPAIVFDQGRAVYYGHDVAKAVEAWNRYASQ